MTKTRINRQWRLITRPKGMLTEEHFEKTTQSISTLKNNQVLIENNYLSFDPTQRVWASVDSYVPKIPLNEVMRAFGIGQVIESRHPQYRVGDYVYGNIGWQDYKLIDTTQIDVIKPHVIPGFLDPKLVVALSITAVTAYTGLHQLARVSAKDTVLVSGAAGAVGAIVCQIAKLKGAFVIGIAGGAQKCQYLLDTLKIDAAIDYKKGNIAEQIKSKVDKGIDIYYDNVGGEMLEAALTQLNKFARVILCGAISQYNTMTAENIKSHNTPAIKNIFNLITQSAKMQGFVMTDYIDDMPKTLMKLYHWVQKNKLKQPIDMQENFDNIPATLTRLFTGQNLGKQLLQLKEPSLPPNKSLLKESLFKLSGYFL